MRKPYYIWDEDGVIKSAMFDEGKQPVNSQLIEPPFIEKPILNNGIVVEGASEQEINDSKIKQALDAETDKYIQRIKDGQEAYSKISAEFRLAKLSGQISEQTHGYIEATLIPVRNEVLAGQWISAKIILESIGAVNIGQDLYDRLHGQIANYINDNY